MKKPNKPIYLEVYFDEVEDIQEGLGQLVNSKEFKNILKEEVLPRLYTAIEEKKGECALFRLIHYGVDLVVDSKQYKKILDRILNIYEQEEEYMKCLEIKKVIDTL